MARLFQSARDAIAGQIQRFRNRDFLEATMAASALVVMADGEVKLSELDTMDQAMETVRELNIYDPHDAVDIYRDYVDALKDDPDAAREDILKMVERIADDRNAAEILIKVCVAIGKADDEFSDPERDAIGQIAARLGLSADDIDL